MNGFFLLVCAAAAAFGYGLFHSILTFFVRKIRFNFLFINYIAPAKYTDKYVYLPDKNFLPVKVSLANLEVTPQLYYDAMAEVSFELYTLKNPTKAQIISPEDNKSITESNLNPNIPTRIIIHGTIEMQMNENFKINPFMISNTGWQERGEMKKTLLNGKSENMRI